MRKSVLLLSLVLQTLVICPTYAGIVVTFSSGAPTGNIVPISLFARSDLSESLNSIDISSISLSAGSFVSNGPFGPLGTPIGSLTTGTLGSANVNVNSFLAIDPSASSNDVAFLQIAYNVPQLYPITNALIASWDINTNGLPVTITIDASSILAFSNVAQLNASVFNNNFVVAVPEPSSLLLLTGPVLAFVIRRNRKLKTKIQVSE